MNLSEVLTGATALAMAVLIARSESTTAPHSLTRPSPSVSSPAASRPAALQPAVSQPAESQPVGRETLRPRTAATMPPPLVYGRARMIHAPTPCDVPTFSEGGPGAPYFVADGLPQAGEPFRVDWTTKPTTPGESPTWPAMLLVSFDLITPMPLDSLGAPGCHLLVQPDHVMMPQPGTILTQSGGCVCLDWTPRAGLVGVTFYAQLLVSAPGVNTGGFLVSPALHLEVGS